MFDRFVYMFGFINAAFMTAFFIQIIIYGSVTLYEPNRTILFVETWISIAITVIYFYISFIRRDKE